jgi:hypothetical protein
MSIKTQPVLGGAVDNNNCQEKPARDSKAAA